MTRLRVTTAGIAAMMMLMVALLGGCSSAPAARESAVASSSLVQQPADTSIDAGEQTTPLVPASPSTPVRIEIPSIGVDSDLIGLGLQPDGTMEVPSGGFPGGWYTGSPTPGELGPSIVAGHVDWDGTPGIFYRLDELSGGDTITVTREDGSRTVFVATEVRSYPKSDFPTETVYGDIDHAGLRLITCGGEFDAGASSYDDNVIAFATLSETVLP